MREGGELVFVAIGANLGDREATFSAVVRALEKVLEPASGAPRTPDLGGTARTADVGRAVAEALR